MRRHGDPNRDYAFEWRNWRLQKGWTQKELASVLGVTCRTVLNIENGHHPPLLRSREKFRALQKKHQEEA